MENNIRMNEWLESKSQKFSYYIYWPYNEAIKADRDIVDVKVRLKGEDRVYLTTFLTIDELKRWFELFKKNGEYKNGTYIPLGKKEFILEKITEDNIEATLEDMLDDNDLPSYLSLIQD